MAGLVRWRFTARPACAGIAMVWLLIAAGTGSAVAQEASALAASQSAELAMQGPTLSLALTPEKAVALALEHNLGLQADRLASQVADLDIVTARTAFTPSAFSRLVSTEASAPAGSVLTTPQQKATDNRRSVQAGVAQHLPWGTEYRIAWDGGTHSSNNLLSRFNPELTSALAFSLVQPLLKGFSIDAPRAELKVSALASDRTDADVDAAIARTARLARRAYWDWSYALDFLDVQRDSSALARELLRQNRERVATGALAAVDVIEAEAEVARRDEQILVAQKNVANLEDSLRALVLEPSSPEWTASFERADRTVPAPPPTVDSVRRALATRHELRVARTNLEIDTVDIALLTSDTRPDVSLQVDYQAQSVGGTELLRTGGFPGLVVGTSTRSFASAFGNLWNNQFPTWSMQLSVSYPLGQGRAEAQRARSTLQRRRSVIALRDAELAVRTQVASAVREVDTNLRRIESTRTSVTLAERRLDAEQRKFSAGLSTSFFVFQAQRDLALAREAALRATVEYCRAHADLLAVEVVPLNAVATTTAAPQR